jgi:hypothetical protein
VSSIERDDPERDADRNEDHDRSYAELAHA